MVTSIQLGNIFSSNGKTVLGGGSSQLDTKTLIEDLSNAKRLPAVQLESRIEQNTALSGAYAELKDILTRFKDSADFLRNPPGVRNATENIFKYRASSLSSNTSVTADNYMNVTVEPGTNTGSYTINEITQLATTTKQESNDFLLADVTDSVVSATPGAGEFGAGTFSIRHIDGTSPDVDITLVAGDSLSTVEAKFNAVKNQTGIQATVLKIADGTPNDTYRLIFSSTQTGTNYAFDLGNVTTVTSDPSGVLTNITKTTTQTAINAIFEIDNAVITRQTNSVDDLISGITFNLKQATPVATELALEIEPDRELVKTAIFNFVDAYNEFKIFAAKQMETNDDGTPLDTALLSGSSSLRTIMSRLTVEVSQAVNGITSGNLDRLSEIGITFNDFPGDSETPFTRNIMNVDEDELDSALEASFDEVRALFEFDFSSDDSDLQVFSRTNSLDVTSFSLSIDQTNGVYQATYTGSGGPVTIDLDGRALSTGSGVVLTGRTGTVLQGLVMLFADPSDTTVNVNLSQGIGDRIFNTLNDILEDDTGVIDVAVSNLADSSERLQKEIDRIDEQVDAFRVQLLRRFSALEQAISQANTLLQSLAAQSSARNNAG